MPNKLTSLTLATCAVAVLVSPCDANAQMMQAAPADVSTPEGVVLATYAAINRAPGAPYDWDRFRSLFLPSAHLIPNVQQTGGSFRVMSVDDFVAWIEAGTSIGSANDRGFREEEVGSTKQEFGVIAQVFSTYQKRYWDDDTVLGIGINTFQLVFTENRWWISAIAWDEERPGLRVPDQFRE